jgi:hypothetical protein
MTNNFKLNTNRELANWREKFRNIHYFLSRQLQQLISQHDAARTVPLHN